MSNHDLLCSLPAKWIDTLLFSGGSAPMAAKPFYYGSARLIRAAVFPFFASIDCVWNTSKAVMERAYAILSKDERAKRSYAKRAERSFEQVRRSVLGVLFSPFGVFIPDIV